MSKPQRRLAAIMFTDIVGYSAMMQKDEAITSRLRNKHREVFNRLTDQFEGEILQYYGDGTLSIFYSTASAVECAVEIQKALKQDPKVPLRIGIHTGDITFNNEDVYGDGVNIASRVESLCIPGGIFISGKVYDDIKNHRTLRAQSMGQFDLKNIKQSIPIYAITNEGVTTPKQRLSNAQSNTNRNRPSSSRRTNTNTSKVAKSKATATKLAFPFGLFGVHRYYLGQKFYGALYPFFFVLGIIGGVALFIIAPPVISFLDMLLFKNMSDEEFDEKYNKGVVSQQAPPPPAEARQTQEPQVTSQKSHLKAQFTRHKMAGLKLFKNYDFPEAIEELKDAADIKYDDAEIHFLLGRCYSMMEDTSNTLTHLDAAVAFGLHPKQILASGELAYIRLQSEFQGFQADNFRLKAINTPPSVRRTFPKSPPKMKKKKVVEEELDTPSPDFLEKLKKLSELRAKGYLTEEEYLQQKEKLRS